jgi:hypothetical protein
VVLEPVSSLLELDVVLSPALDDVVVEDPPQLAARTESAAISSSTTNTITSSLFMLNLRGLPCCYQFAPPGDRCFCTSCFEPACLSLDMPGLHAGKPV